MANLIIDITLPANENLFYSIKLTCTNAPFSPVPSLIVYQRFKVFFEPAQSAFHG